MLNTPTQLRSILASPKVLADVGNLIKDTIVSSGDIWANNDEVSKPDAPSENAEGEQAAVNPQPKPKRAKKQVRILLDARTELTDKELKDARDNYIQEQARQRRELEHQQYNKEAANRVHDLLLAPPAISGYQLITDVLLLTICS
jgi:meiotic recombination protein REC8